MNKTLVLNESLCFGIIEKRATFCHTHVDTNRLRAYMEIRKGNASNVLPLKSPILFVLSDAQPKRKLTARWFISHHQIILMRSQTEWPWEQWNRFVSDANDKFWNTQTRPVSRCLMSFQVEVLVRVNLTEFEIFSALQCKWELEFFTMKTSILKMRRKKGTVTLFYDALKDENPIQWTNQLEFVAQVNDIVCEMWLKPAPFLD